MGRIALHFCPAGHGAAIDGATLEAHEHRHTRQCGMHEAVHSAPAAGAHCKSRMSPWYPGRMMELRQVEGVTIDYCAVERGVWLDAPEILAIINVMRRRESARVRSNLTYDGPGDVLSEVAAEIAIHTSDAWGPAAVDVVVNVAKGVGEASYYIVEAAGSGVEIAGEVAGGIIEFIADALG